MLARRAIVVVALTVMPLLAASASAQPPASDATRRPFRGLFGAPPPAGSPHFLVLSASVFAAYDANEVEGFTGQQASTPWLLQTGPYQGANLGLDYTFSRMGDRINFGGHLGGRLNYYHRRERSKVLPSNQADVTFGARMTRTLTFSARQSASYTSNYNRALAPGLGGSLGDDIGIVPDDAMDVFELRVMRMASTVGLAQSFGRFTSLSGAYLFRSVEVLDDDVPNSPLDDYRSQAGSVNLQYARPMTRHATLALGYGVRASDGRSGGEPDVLHNINAGVNYGRALSFSRRTSFSFSTGSAVAVTDRTNTPADDRRTRMYLIGDAALLHEMGRTWTASLTYSRALRTWDELDQLYFTQAVNARIGGLVSRRISISANGSWADSSLQNQSGGTHRGYAANARAQYALARFAAFYAQYVYYNYRFSDVVTLDGRFPRQLNRRGVRVGLTTSVPLIR
jgi:hypothetical protein